MQGTGWAVVLHAEKRQVVRAILRGYLDSRERRIIA